jgi:hypothetical protein
MVRIYSKIPTQSTDAKASLGMYYLDVVDPFGKPSRPTVGTYAKILAVLSQKIRYNKYFGARKSYKSSVLLLSRVYLYLGDDANVILYGNLALAEILYALGLVW